MFSFQGKQWKLKTDEEKAYYQKLSLDSFQQQRQSCLEVGVHLKPCQLKNLPEKEEAEEVPSPVSQSSPAILGDRYKIIGSAKGQGAYGTVYVVEEVRTGRNYAAKTEAITSSLKNEVEILSALSHPSIMPILDYHVCVGGLSWFIMPRAPQSVWGFLKSNTLGRSTQVALCSQLLDGLGYMHKNGVIHGDVKPSNIMYNPGSQCFFIIDFGMSITLPVAREHANDTVYTIQYRAPELFESRLKA